MLEYATRSRQRLEQARRIADGLRHDENLHRLAMKAVFLLEDTHEVLVRLGSGESETSRYCEKPPAEWRRLAEDG